MLIWNGFGEYCWRYRADTILSTDGRADNVKPVYPPPPPPHTHTHHTHTHTPHTHTHPWTPLRGGVYECLHLIRCSHRKFRYVGASVTLRPSHQRNRMPFISPALQFHHTKHTIGLIVHDTEGYDLIIHDTPTACLIRVKSKQSVFWFTHSAERSTIQVFKGQRFHDTAMKWIPMHFITYTLSKTGVIFRPR